MRAIVGIDNAGTYHPALDLLKRFEFPNLVTTLVHIADSKLRYSTADAGDVEMNAEFAKIAHERGEAVLHGAMRHAGQSGLSAKSMMLVGKPSGALMAQCDTDLADLVAVCASQRSENGVGRLGSVSRALAIASRTSVLVAKWPIADEGRLKVVYATDHSGFADRCLTRFIKMAPKGVQEVCVVSAYEVDDKEAEVLGKNIAMLGGDVDRFIAEFVERANARVCKLLSEAGYSTTSIVAKGDPMAVIHNAMSDTHSDLVIVGSQGNGFFDRDLIGSVSLHQVVGEDYPVLIIRP